MASATMLVGGPFLVLGPGASPAAAAGYKSSGTFTLSGAVTGTLRVPASENRGGLPGCAISGISGSGATEAGTDTINWDNVKLEVGKRSEVVSFVSLSVDTPRFGRAYSMAEEGKGPYSGVSLLVGSVSYSSVSGSAVTAKRGVSGSLNGALKSTTGQPSQLKIKGHWAGCAKVRA